MMYKELLVLAVKANGKILREQKDSVFLPFGCEYSLVIKNKNSLRALVRVEIDGVDVTDGTQLIVPPNGSLDLERFIKGKNFDHGNRFKFIERTAKIENGPRGIKAEDGLIRIEFEFERQPAPIVNYIQQSWSPTYTTTWRSELYRSVGTAYPGPLDVLCEASYDDKTSYSVTGGAQGLSGQGAYSANCLNSSDTVSSLSNTAPATRSTGAVNASAVQSDVGITVPGSVSDQKFVTGAWFATDGVKHVMVMKLLGQVGNQRVSEPITAKAKPTCITCGTVNKGNAKFCRECGTGLTLL